jgi:PAT family acetyl-CoA transporter-like MFS transporter 1
MPKSDLATISPLLLIVGLVLPLLTSNMVNEHPMKTFLWGIKAKMVSSFLLWIISGFTSSAYANPDNVSITYLTTLTITMVANECFGTMIFVSAMTFFSKISDPAIGGSYMTLLNTIANWGSKWPNVTMLWLLPKLTLNVCDQPTNPILNALLSCSETSNPYIVDGYSILVILCTMVGALWLATQQKQITDLENIEHAKWIVTNAIK